MDRILVTGATGFVGHWLNVKKPANTYLHRMGQSKYNSMEWAKARWDGIFHLAPIAPNDVLECAKHNNCRVLFASSGVIYHPENDVYKQYRENKIAWEKDCIDSGVDAVIARLFAFYGDKIDDNKAISAFHKAAATNAPIIITGDGSTVRTYQHGAEMARWLWAIFERGKSGEAYDVGSDSPITLLELAESIVKYHNSSSEIKILGGVDPMPYYVPQNISETLKLLNK